MTRNHQAAHLQWGDTRWRKLIWRQPDVLWAAQEGPWRTQLHNKTKTWNEIPASIKMQNNMINSKKCMQIGEMTRYNSYDVPLSLLPRQPEQTKRSKDKGSPDVLPRGPGWTWRTTTQVTQVSTILAGCRDSNPRCRDSSQVCYQWATHIPEWNI